MALCMLSAHATYAQPAPADRSPVVREPAAALVLSRLWEHDLSHLPPIGGASVSATAIVAWTADGSTIVLFANRDATVRIAVPQLQRPLAVRAMPNGLLRIVDAASESCLTASWRGGVMTRSSLHRAGQSIVAAEITDTFVYVVEADRQGSFTLTERSGCAGSPRKIAKWVGRIAESQREFAPPLLTVTSPHVLATERNWPFEVRRIHLGTGRIERHVIGVEDREQLPIAPLATSARWLAGPVLPLDDGYVSTVIDLNSDRRVIVLFDRHLRVKRTRTIDSPMGFIASEPHTGRLFAVLYGAAQKLIAFERTPNVATQQLR